MNEVMIDIETKGKKAGCAILSIGAVVFNRKTGRSVDTFYANLDTDFQELVGFHVDQSTMDWWKEQPEQAWNQTQTDKESIIQVLGNLKKWFESHKCTKMWCQGASFDAPILEHAFATFGIEQPWKFWNVRDTRTAYDVTNFNRDSIPREGTYHNALDDSLHQIKCLVAATKK